MLVYTTFSKNKKEVMKEVRRKEAKRKDVKRKEEVIQVTEDNTTTKGDILEEINIEEIEQIGERFKKQVVKK